MPPPAFTGRDSYQRLQQLQDLCIPDDERGFDAVLLVGGADGLYSPGSQAALKYLFLGKSGQDLLGEQVIPQQYEALEDIVIVLTRTSVSIFYILDSDSATFLLPFVSNWRNVTEYVATDDMTQDVRELTKIRAFRSMVEPHRVIGIPLHEPGKPSKEAPTAEAWPIVQSFGLDEFHPASTAKGFFSMHHSVVNCAMALTARLTDIDDFFAQRLVTDAEPALAHHFDGFLAKLDHADTPAARGAFTEADIADDLSSFYDFGTIRHDARGLTKSAHRGASVHFGTRTSAAPSMPSSKTVLAHQAGVSGQFPATHFTVVAEEPLTGLRVGRTYFLGTGKCAGRIVDPDALVSPGDATLDRYESVPSNAPDTLRLIALYTKLLAVHTSTTLPAVVASAKAYGASPAQWATAAHEAAMHAFRLQITDEFGDAPASLATQLTVTVDVVDACGESVAAIEPHAKWSHAYVTTSIAAVSSTVAKGANLGALVVGDSILVDIGTCAFLVITAASFPAFRTWIQPGMEADHAAHVDTVLASDYMLDHVVQVGRPIREVVSPAPVLVDSDHLHVIQGSLQPYAHGFVLKSPHSHPLVVSFPTHVRSLRVLSTPYDELLLVVVDFVSTSNPVLEWLPGAATPAAASIALPLVAGSRMQICVLGVLDEWKASAAAHDIPFLKPATDALEPIPLGFQRGCDALLGKSPDSATRDRLFPQWCLSKAPSPVPPSWTRPTSMATLVVPVTVFIGLPGSEVQSLATSLTELTARANAWHHVVVDTRELPADAADTAACIRTKVADALASITSSDVVGWLRRPRILVTVVGYVDPIGVCAAIESTDRSLTLSTVIAVVSSVAVTVPESANPFPKLWDQLAAGFITTIVLTHTQELDHVCLHRLRTRVDAANPFADVLCLRSNSLDGDLTAFVALDEFNAPDRQRYRDVHFPSWQVKPAAYAAPLPPSVSAVRFEMQLQLDRTRFVACIHRGLSPTSTLHSIAPVHPALPPPQLSGLRLAQALALEKVTQSTLLGTTSDGHGVDLDDVAAIVAHVGQVWTVEASLAFTDDVHHGYTYLSTGTKSFLRPQSSSPPTACTFAFTGANLQPEKLRQLLLQCCPSRHPAVAAIESVTLDEKRRIQALHVTDPLPDGYMFDGTAYYDYFGGHHEFHPNIQRFIDEHVAMKNAAASRQNNELEQDHLRYEERTKQL
ncbi:hypothetical protein H310_10818 [Aphanomyces invadans]|uniref:Uncharacterized protein n=1 Tax=Aphanomyces invadans TaxID=157072 RepID=A0A024TQ43_9STRA|nr:hypothetical protein H310_10818 [Aphanomyces invadans]ETV95746.1 hypothetical protein H310_10818 [Aphanomyces invadans]|eukprot:XP_008875497.1 hypothetical protein H310_10818 [Aphanomyces invadans]